VPGEVAWGEASVIRFFCFSCRSGLFRFSGSIKNKAEAQRKISHWVLERRRLKAQRNINHEIIEPWCYAKHVSSLRVMLISLDIAYGFMYVKY
jgi:hypothetical protein